MITKLSNPEKPKPKMEQFLPGLIIFGITLGPFLMVNGLHGPITSFAGSGYVAAVIGYVMLSTSLIWLYRRQVSLEHRLNELERLKK